MTQDLIIILTRFKADFVEFIPQLTLAVTILLLGTLFAFILKWLSMSFIKWIFKIIPKHVSHRMMNENDITRFSKLIGRIVFSIIIFLTTATALKKLGLLIVSSWFEMIASYLPNMLAALIIFVFGWKIKDFLEELLFSSLSQINFAQARALSKMASWTIFAISTVVALEQIGLNIDILINLAVILFGIIAGGIALTFSLGAKSNISDILSCYQISRHLKIGEQINIADYKGTVESIGPVFIILESEDKKVALPGSFFNKNIFTIRGGGSQL